MKKFMLSVVSIFMFVVFTAGTAFAGNTFAIAESLKIGNQNYVRIDIYNDFDPTGTMCRASVDNENRAKYIEANQRVNILIPAYAYNVDVRVYCSGTGVILDKDLRVKTRRVSYR